MEVVWKVGAVRQGGHGLFVVRLAGAVRPGPHGYLLAMMRICFLYIEYVCVLKLSV